MKKAAWIEIEKAQAEVAAIKKKAEEENNTLKKEAEKQLKASEKAREKAQAKAEANSLLITMSLHMHIIYNKYAVILSH